MSNENDTLQTFTSVTEISNYLGISRPTYYRRLSALGFAKSKKKFTKIELKKLRSPLQRNVTHNDDKSVTSVNFEFEKNYQAVVCGNLREDFGTFEDYLLKNGKTNKTEVVKAGTPDAKKAELDYELIDCIETKEGVLTWILVILHTGRHHQIRVQMAHAGMPLAGDRKYGAGTNVTIGAGSLALCAASLTFFHPVTGKVMKFVTKPEGTEFKGISIPQM